MPHKVGTELRLPGGMVMYLFTASEVWAAVEAGPLLRRKGRGVCRRRVRHITTVYGMAAGALISCTLQCSQVSLLLLNTLTSLRRSDAGRVLLRPVE